MKKLDTIFCAIYIVAVICLPLLAVAGPLCKTLGKWMEKTIEKWSQ